MTTAEIVRAALAGLSRGTQPFRYRFSNAGEPCVRAHVYDAMDADDGKPPAPGNSQPSWILSSVCGNAVGDALEAAIVRLGLAQAQVSAEFDTGAVKVRGQADAVTPTTVLDWKLVAEKRWAKVQAKPDPKHVLQVNGYAVALERPRWALVYVRAVSIFDGSHVPEFVVHEGDADVSLAQELCGVWESVETHRRLRTLPERVWGAAPSRFPCGWCRHLERCAPSGEEQSNEP